MIIFIGRVIAHEYNILLTILLYFMNSFWVLLNESLKLCTRSKH